MLEVFNSGKTGAWETKCFFIFVESYNIFTLKDGKIKLIILNISY
jgi:hypothetical protein